MQEPIVFELDQLESVVERIKKVIDLYQVITFSGELGAGKTTIVKALLKAYGIGDVITSPTFTYVNCYIDALSQRFYHFDLYRIADPEQFVVLGFDEYLENENSKVFIEWPERISAILPERKCAITIEHYGAQVRRISIIGS